MAVPEAAGGSLSLWVTVPVWTIALALLLVLSPRQGPVYVTSGPARWQACPDHVAQGQRVGRSLVGEGTDKQVQRMGLLVG